MRSALKRIVKKLSGRRVRARLLAEPPKLVSEGWLIRLRCQNPGPTEAFDAAIVSVDGVPASELRLPRYLSWRGGAGNGPLELRTRQAGLLRLAIFHPGAKPTWILLGGSVAGGPEFRHALVARDEIDVEVRLRRGDRTDVQRRVHLSCRANAQGEFVPIVTFAS